MLHDIIEALEKKIESMLGHVTQLSEHNRNLRQELQHLKENYHELKIKHEHMIHGIERIIDKLKENEQGLQDLI